MLSALPPNQSLVLKGKALITALVFTKDELENETPVLIKYAPECRYVLRLFAQSCLALSDPMGCSLPDSSIHGDSLGKNTGVGYHALLQGIFPMQGSNPDLPHCMWILYHQSHEVAIYCKCYVISHWCVTNSSFVF